MSEELAKTGESQITLPQVDSAIARSQDSDNSFEAATTSTKFLPRLQLMTAASEKVKSGEFPPNHYALVKDQQYRDIGGETQALILAWRPKALEISDDGVNAVYDPKLDDNNQPTGEFQRIKDAAANGGQSFMYGPEFLVWLPSIEQFATLFLGSKSARREAPNVKARLRSAATLGSKKIVSSKYTWFAPQVMPCSETLTPPDPKKLAEEYERFVNPPESELETVDDSEDRAR